MNDQTELHRTMRLGVVAICLTIGFSTYLLLVTAVKHQRATQKKLDLIERKMESMLTDRSVLDAAYKEHLSTCAFISRDEVKVDSHGYFYSEYRRKGR